MNVKLEFNQEILKKMKANNISSDNIGSTLFILFALYEGRFDLLDEFDDNNRERRAVLLYRHLDRRGFIERADEVNPVNYILTKRGYTLIEEIKAEFDIESTDATVKQLESIAIEEVTSTPLLEEVDVNTWIKDYIKLFPEGEYFGRRLRTNSKEAIERMNWFIETYGFDKDTIMQATKKYVDSQQTYQFTLGSTTFIWKAAEGSRKESDRVSSLASWCEGVIENKDKPQDKIYDEAL